MRARTVEKLIVVLGAAGGVWLAITLHWLSTTQSALVTAVQAHNDRIRSINAVLEQYGIATEVRETLFTAAPQSVREIGVK